MTFVSGDLILVTDDPARVTGAWVHATTRRLDGNRVVLTGQGQAVHAGGRVEFEAVPGPAVLELRLLGGESDTVALVVPDASSASLADCVRNAEMAGDRDVGELAGILEQIRGSVGASAEARAGAEAAAEGAAGSAASAGRDADRAESAAGEAATEAAGLAADAVRLEVRGDADRSAAGATTATEKAAEAAGSATRAETAEAGAVEAEEGAEAGQELSEDSAAVAVAAAIGVQTAFHQYTGVGSPEGKVSAPAGADYTDTAATAGAIRWVKVSGTGSTGWVVEYGDTGWRNITANNEIFGTVGEGGAVTIRRSGDVVTFRLLGPIIADDRGRFEVRNISYRFTPAMRLYLPMATFEGDFKPQVTQYHFQIAGQPAGQTIVRSNGNVEFMWTTTAAWPTSLPGTPA